MMGQRPGWHRMAHTVGAGPKVLMALLVVSGCVVRSPSVRAVDLPSAPLFFLPALVAGARASSTAPPALRFRPRASSADGTADSWHAVTRGTRKHDTSHRTLPHQSVSDVSHPRSAGPGNDARRGSRSLLQASNLEKTGRSVLVSENSTSLSEARHQGIGTAVIGNKAFFAGGYKANTTSAFSNVVDILESIHVPCCGDVRVWTTATLSAARYGVAGAALRHVAMFFGGVGGSVFAEQPSNVVDIYNEQTDA
jgi:hypothetical protein